MIYDQMAIFCKAWNPSMEEEDVVKTTTTAQWTHFSIRQHRKPWKKETFCFGSNMYDGFDGWWQSQKNKEFLGTRVIHLLGTKLWWFEGHKSPQSTKW